MKKKELVQTLQEINLVLETIKNSLAVFYELSESINKLNNDFNQLNEHFSHLSKINNQLKIAYNQGEEKNKLLEKVLSEIQWANKRLEE
ncbi:MAG: hypothetical protein ACRC8P_02790 [Spiroplasma sp.]